MAIPGTGQGQSQDPEERGDLSRLSPVKWLRLDLNADAWKTPMSLLFLCFAMHLNQAEREQRRMDGAPGCGQSLETTPLLQPPLLADLPLPKLPAEPRHGPERTAGAGCGPAPRRQLLQWVEDVAAC